MDDQDDPEKRIAELERQLAERSRVAEPGYPQADVRLSSGGEAPAQPTQGGQYGIGPAGVDFQRWQRRRPLNRSRLVWILVAFWVVMIPVGNGLGWVFTHLRHYFPSGSQSSSGDMTVEPGGVLSFGGNSETQRLACNGGTVNLSGNDNTFTVTGHCQSVHVSGNRTRVTVDSADTIDAGGIQTVTIYHFGTPQINKSGIDVTVSQG